ncbi:hypothetical protein J6590_043492 [Homalodisca vitripennis]|nr:hypothetical protein J6590_043492 [Homalodisca vitripennis]
MTGLLTADLKCGRWFIWLSTAYSLAYSLLYSIPLSSTNFMLSGSCNELHTSSSLFL